MNPRAMKTVGIDDLFFSTTDRRGVIELANAFFVEISGYDRDRLVGSPHSIIRHPDMPGAVFHLMWQTLQAGRPFVGYVHNQASDGATYTVCAAVTPMPSGGYLSVRMGPSRTDLLQQVDAAYRAVRNYEGDLVAGGEPRRDAARLGAERLLQILDEAGFSSYDRLQQDILPSELTAHAEVSDGIPSRPATQGKYAQLLPTIGAIAGELQTWLADVESLTALSEALNESAARLRSEIDDVSATASRITQAANGSPELEATFASLVLWTQMQAIVQGHVADLIDTLDKLDALSRETRLHLGFAHLYTRMNAKFAAELIDTVAPDEGADQATVAMSLIAESLQHELTEMDRLSVEHRAMTKRTNDAISRTSELMQLPRELLQLWRAQVDASAIPASAAELVREIGQSLDNADSAITLLSQATERCSALGDGHDSTALQQQLARLRELTATGGVHPTDDRLTGVPVTGVHPAP